MKKFMDFKGPPEKLAIAVEGDVVLALDHQKNQLWSVKCYGCGNKAIKTAIKPPVGKDETFTGPNAINSVPVCSDCFVKATVEFLDAIGDVIRELPGAEKVKKLFEQVIRVQETRNN